MALVLDTGPLLAALDAADPDHDACAGLLLGAQEDLVVPTLVLAELDYWCHERLTADAWLAFLGDLIEGVYRTECPTDTDLRRCDEIQRRYGDQRVGSWTRVSWPSSSGWRRTRSRRSITVTSA